MRIAFIVLISLKLLLISLVCVNTQNACDYLLWSEWSPCSVSCGVGVRTRLESDLDVTKLASLQLNATCEPKNETRVCQIELECPVRNSTESVCSYSSWSSWTTCSKTCGGGIQERVQEVSVSESSSAEAALYCPKLTDQRRCATVSCNEDCILSEWYPWAECPLSCGVGGKRARYRLVMQSLSNSPNCSALSEQQDCVQDPCPQDCIVSAWASWSQCNCHNLMMSRRRFVLLNSSDAGVTCPSLDQQVRCEATCPPARIDCELSQWTNWTVCSAECGYGIQFRSREITQEPQFGGLRCAFLRHQVECIEKICSNSSLCFNQTDGNYANPEEKCSPIFFSCVAGFHIAHHCPDDLVFDTTKQQCELAQSVKQCEGTLRAKKKKKVVRVQHNLFGRKYLNRLPSSGYFAVQIDAFLILLSLSTIALLIIDLSLIDH